MHTYLEYVVHGFFVVSVVNVSVIIFIDLYLKQLAGTGGMYSQTMYGMFQLKTTSKQQTQNR